MPPVQSEYSAERRACCSSAISGIAIGANFTIYLLRQICSNRVHFYNTQETQKKKLWTRVLKFEFCDFWELFEIFEKASRGPSAADLDHYGSKLDHSRVLVNKFPQNRSTLKGRSAGQRQTDRQTDRQTNSTDNKGPSGLQSGQKTDRTDRQTTVR